MTEARGDFETRSDVDIRGLKIGPKGSGRYFESPHFAVLLGRWSVAGGPLIEWRIGQPCPEPIKQHAVNAGTWRAFNAGFERRCMRWLAANADWPEIPVDRYRCTAAEAAAMGLPRSLDAVADALGLPVAKDKRGAALIQKFSIPRRLRDGEAPGVYFNEPDDFPEDFAAFGDYCAQDVKVEEGVAARTIRLSDYEQAVYAMDQIINDRGLRIDTTSAVAAIELAAKALARLDEELRDVTGGVVRKCSDVARLLQWIQGQGVELNNAQKSELLDLLECDDLPPVVRRAVEIRQEGGKTSVTKFQGFLDYMGGNGRVRHIYTYHAASTGRWQARGVNMNNLPRPRREFDDAHLDRKVLFDAIKSAEPEVLDLFYGQPLGRPLHLLSDAIRGFIWAAPGHDLVQADYSGIEGAVIAWTSGEDWKVQALHDIIADPKLPDMYRRTAASIMNTTTDEITKKHPLRQSVGKVPELALGFGGGVPAFYSMSRNYSVKLDPLFEPVWATASEERREKAVKRYEGQLKRGLSKTDTLSRNAWIACELIKVGWRATNPAIAGGWKLREDAIREAIRAPGSITTALKMQYVVKRGFLWCMLPSGRCLAYASPKLRDQVWARVRLSDLTWSEAEVMDREQAEKLELKGLVRIDGATSQGISCLGVDKSGKKMKREPLYGGLVAENDTQAIARDLLVNGMFKAEAAGYQVIGHVYDEIIAEVPRGFGDLGEFEQLICELPVWAAGLPLTAGGWRGKRYRKE